MKNMKKLLLTMIAMLTFVFALQVSVGAVNKVTLGNKKIKGTKYYCVNAQVPAYNAAGSKIKAILFGSLNVASKKEGYDTKAPSKISGSTAYASCPVGDLQNVYSDTGYLYLAVPVYADDTIGKTTPVVAFDNIKGSVTTLINRKKPGFNLHLYKGDGIAKYVIKVKKKGGSFKTTKTITIKSGTSYSFTTLINKVGKTAMSSGAGTYYCKVFAYVRHNGKLICCKNPYSFKYTRKIVRY